MRVRAKRIAHVVRCVHADKTRSPDNANGAITPACVLLLHVKFANIKYFRWTFVRFISTDN